MDQLIFGRCQQYIISKLDSEISNPNCSKILMLICEYVENFLKNLDLSGIEKKILSLDWLQKILPSLTTSEVQMCSDWLERVIEATQGLFNINQKTVVTPSVTTTVSAPVPTTTPTPVIASGTATISKKTSKLWGGKPNSCIP